MTKSVEYTIATNTQTPYERTFSSLDELLGHLRFHLLTEGWYRGENQLVSFGDKSMRFRIIQEDLDGELKSRLTHTVEKRVK